MATRMPDLGPLAHCASVSYDCTFSGLTAQGGTVAFGVPNPVQFVFFFETGSTQPDPQKDLNVYTWDYSKFDQDQVEAAIDSTLDGICQDIAGLLGVAQPAVQATVQVQRAWMMAGNQRGTAAATQLPPEGVLVTEVMPYPLA